MVSGVSKVAVVDEIHQITSDIISKGESGSFLVTDLAVVRDQFQLWQQELPNVLPMYAVKANPDLRIINLLAKLGTGFDVASAGEIGMVCTELTRLHEQKTFVQADDNEEDTQQSLEYILSSRMVYANPCKQQKHLEFSMDNGVELSVFDCSDELHKIANTWNARNAASKTAKPFRLLLRLTTDDKDSICPFSNKFGCKAGKDASELVDLCDRLGLELGGVSFHVGSGCGDATAYTIALEQALEVFSYAKENYTFNMNVLDIGGGFPGDDMYGSDLPDFQALAKTIRQGLMNFPSSVRIIAEPGRFFTSAATSACTKIYGRKNLKTELKDIQGLTVDDGVYGTFNNIVYDHYVATPEALKYTTNGSICTKAADEADDQEMLTTAIWGPTCDGLDELVAVSRNFKMRHCAIDEWLLWKNMGAYTHTASFEFNGLTHKPRVHYINAH